MIRIKARVLTVIIQRAVKVIGARLDRRVNDGPCCASNFSGWDAGRYFELRNGVRIRKRTDRTKLGAEIAAPPDRLKREDSELPCELLLPGPPEPALGSPLLKERASGPPPRPTLFARTTPGVSVASSVKLRPDNGNSVTSRPLITLPRSLDSVSTSGGAAVIVTSPLTLPGGSVRSILNRSFVCRTTFSCVTV